MKAELPVMASELGVRFHAGEKIKAKDLKKLRKRLKAQQYEQGIEFVYGKGQRKTLLQRTAEQLFKDGQGRHVHADEGRPHEKRAAEAGLQCDIGSGL